MEREILFKAKRVDNGEWVEGLLIESKNNECHILVKNYNPIKKQGNGHWYIDSPCFQVNPETVCQFTGMLDKNGNKIFEGDICLDMNEETRIIEYSYGAWSWNYYENPELDWKKTGNIHDK